MLVRKGAPEPVEVVPKKEAGMPLGIMEGSTYSAVQVGMQPGDSLLLYTDGVPDAESLQGKQFGQEGIYAVLRNGAVGAKGVVEGLARAVQAHQAGNDPFDDITMVSLGRLA